MLQYFDIVQCRKQAVLVEVTYAGPRILADLTVAKA